MAAITMPPTMPAVAPIEKPLNAIQHKQAHTSIPTASTARGRNGTRRAKRNATIPVTAKVTSTKERSNRGGVRSANPKIRMTGATMASALNIDWSTAARHDTASSRRDMGGHDTLVVRMRVLLADDHHLVRAGIRALLETLPDVEVVAEAGNGQEALAAIAKTKPDIALVDISMPGLNGLELAARAAREAPETRLVILSVHGDASHVAQALRLGAKGYLVKDAAADELPIVVRSVMRGETYLSPSISRHVVDGFLARGKAPDSENPAAGDVLTPRQRETLQLVAEGRSTKEIARLLDLSVKTVETHRAQIMDRLGIHDLAGLVRYAVRAGLVSSER